MKSCALTRHDPQLKFDIETFDWGSDYYKKHGVMMPEEGLNMLKAFDAIYFGAVGADVPDHITLWGLRLPVARALTSTPMCDPQNSAGRHFTAAQPRAWRS